MLRLFYFIVVVRLSDVTRKWIKIYIITEIDNETSLSDNT